MRSVSVPLDWFCGDSSTGNNPGVPLGSMSGSQPGTVPAPPLTGPRRRAAVSPPASPEAATPLGGRRIGEPGAEPKSWETAASCARHSRRLQLGIEPVAAVEHAASEHHARCPDAQIG